MCVHSVFYQLAWNPVWFSGWGSLKCSLLLQGRCCSATTDSKMGVTGSEMCTAGSKMGITGGETGVIGSEMGISGSTMGITGCEMGITGSKMDIIT